VRGEVLQGKENYAVSLPQLLSNRQKSISSVRVGEFLSGSVKNRSFSTQPYRDVLAGGAGKELTYPDATSH
jgi:hypothetical protein